VTTKRTSRFIDEQAADGSDMEEDYSDEFENSEDRDFIDNRRGNNRNNNARSNARLDAQESEEESIDDESVAKPTKKAKKTKPAKKDKPVKKDTPAKSSIGKVDQDEVPFIPGHLRSMYKVMRRRTAKS